MFDLKTIQSGLKCPDCGSPSLVVNEKGTDIVCASCDNRYPLSSGRPVLLRTDNPVFCAEDYRQAMLPSLDQDFGLFQRFMPKSSVNLASKRVLQNMRGLLLQKPRAVVLVVGGGCQRKWLDERLGSGDSIRVIYSDIDSGADVDLFCDGHDLPFINGYFDAVVTTAVLEHVLYPERVAAEITRVLKEGGLLYSELPFMQQVHEGAYDFTRYTLSGHRRLFNEIDEIESGMVAGPGTALVWAIENFFLAFISSPFMRNLSKVMTRVLFGWVKYFDFMLVNRPAAMDGASCTYLLGNKTRKKIPDSEIIRRYVGAKHLRHT